MEPYKPYMPAGSNWAEELPAHFWDNLKSRPPEEAAAATAAELDQGRFILPLFSRPYLVDPEHRRIQDIFQPEAQVDYNTGLVLVTHLAKATMVPPAGRMMAPGDLPGGRALLAGPHALPLEPITEHFGRNPEALVHRALGLGGEEIDGANAAVCLPGLPRVPMYLLLWVADEEFPAQAKFGMDANILHHLDLDGILALSHLMVQRLTELPVIRNK